LRTRYRKNRGGGERDIIAVILRDDVIVKILEHVGLPIHLPALKPARAPPPRPARKQATRSPLPADAGFFADPDSISFELYREDEADRCYSEFDCMDEPPQVEEKAQKESKEARKPKSILELVEHFPGKTLCWASELEEKKNEPE